MKALLRSSILALTIFGSYAAFSSAQISTSAPQLPVCPGTRPQASLCVAR